MVSMVSKESYERRLLLEVHGLFTTSIGIKVGLVVDGNFLFLFLIVFLFNNVFQCHVVCEIL